MTEQFAVPPEPIHAALGKPLRFAVGSPDGARSSTWTVVGSSRTRDVYVAARPNMHRTKLSLHQSGKWRMATVESTSEHEDRVLSRYSPPPEWMPGWRKAVTIVVPTEHLREAYPERASSASRPISWWPAPPSGSSLWFEVLLGEAGAGGTVLDTAGEVGRFPLADGGAVWVVAHVVEDGNRAAEWEKIRAELEQKFGDLDVALEYPSAMAWGHVNDDGHPFILDMGNPSTPVAGRGEHQNEFPL